MSRSTTLLVVVIVGLALVSACGAATDAPTTTEHDTTTTTAHPGVETSTSFAPWNPNTTTEAPTSPPADSQSGLSLLFVDVSKLPQNAFGFIQLLFLGGAYAYILMWASNLIKDGSELLLLIPSWAGVVGPIVLPVLGAVPDGAIVLFSGMGPDAQTQLSVGIGALAGSTIMLLTVPWVLSQIAGRVNVDSEGNGNYVRPRGTGADWAKLNPPGKVLGTGVNFAPSINYVAKIMLLTCVSFLVIQIPAIVGKCSTNDQVSSLKCQTPRLAALIGGILSVLLFFFYLFDQYRLAKSSVVIEKRVEEARRNAVGDGLVSMTAVFQPLLQQKLLDKADSAATSSPEEGRLVNTSSDISADMAKFLRPYFKMYDVDGSGSLDAKEIVRLLRDLNEDFSPSRISALMASYDQDHSGTIDFNEFVKLAQEIVEKHTPSGSSPLVSGGGGGGAAAASRTTADERSESELRGASEGAAEDEEGEEEEEEEEEMPSDLVGLSPGEQQKRLLRRSMFLMGVGTVVVLVVSDAMVDVLSELGNRIHLSPFYVAFVLAPLVSNGSELIAAFAYASKKTEASITISLSTLLGAACMNNTFCLSIFLWLVYLQNLQWEFIAETMVILLVQIVMFLLVFRSRGLSTWVAGVVAALFPLALVFVALMENVAGLD